MISSCMHYLGSAAMREFDKAKGIIKWNSASKYASNAMMFLVDKFRTEDQIPVLRDEQWKVLRKQLLKMHTQDCKKTGKKLFIPFVDRLSQTDSVESRLAHS
jgi:hypothetical protein